MSLVTPTTGEVLMLQYILNVTPADNRILHLYQNNVTPVQSTVLGDLVEANQPGYNPITLMGSNWTITTTAGISTASYPEQVFIFTSAATIFGYFITTTNNQLLWVERFSNGPYTLPTNGGELAVTPNFSLD
jgi:hypothetical protein